MRNWLNTKKLLSGKPTKGIWRNSKRNMQRRPRVSFLVPPSAGLLILTVVIEGKRSKLETETSNSTTRSNSNDQGERAPTRRVSSAQSDNYTGHHRSKSSPPVGPQRLPSVASHPSKSTSPATHSLSGFNSPRMADHYSPLSASPRSASLHKENSFETHPSAMTRAASGHSDINLPYPASAYGHPPSQPSSNSPPAAYGSHYQPPIDLPSRRSMRESSRLPPLTHEDTTLSSDSGQTSYSTSYSGPLLPMIDASKSMRTLPAPVPSAGAAPSPLDRPPIPATAPSQQPDYRASAPLAALLRAGELARTADEEIEK